MFENPLNLLYIVLAAIILLIGILLAIAIVYLIMILRDASKASYYVRDTAEKVNEFVYKPLMMATTIVENLKPILETLQEKGEGILKKKKKKKK